MKRRTLLGSVGAVGASSVAGCLDELPFGESETKLARLSVANFDTDDARTIDVRVERDDSVVHESTYTIETAGANSARTAIADCTWDDVAGEYVVAARLAGATEWQTFDLLEEADGSPDCVIARLQYGDFPTGPDDGPLNIEVRARCDEVGENYASGCPAYTHDSTDV